MSPGGGAGVQGLGNRGSRAGGRVRRQTVGPAHGTVGANGSRGRRPHGALRCLCPHAASEPEQPAQGARAGRRPRLWAFSQSEPGPQPPPRHVSAAPRASPFSDEGAGALASQGAPPAVQRAAEWSESPCPVGAERSHGQGAWRRWPVRLPAAEGGGSPRSALRAHPAPPSGRRARLWCPLPGPLCGAPGGTASFPARPNFHSIPFNL